MRADGPRWSEIQFLGVIPTEVFSGPLRYFIKERWIMKRTIYAIIFSAAIFSFSSCEEIVLDGAWDPIELDKSHVNFPPEGGQNTVSALNYTRWWISSAYETGAYVDQHWEYTGFVHPTSSGGEQAYTYDLLDGGWYRVTVPDQGRSRTIIITVDPLGDAKPRQAVIEMTVGDAFTKVSIAQQ